MNIRERLQNFSHVFYFDILVWFNIPDVSDTSLYYLVCLSIERIETFWRMYFCPLTPAPTILLWICQSINLFSPPLKVLGHCTLFITDAHEIVCACRMFNPRYYLKSSLSRNDIALSGWFVRSACRTSVAEATPYAERCFFVLTDIHLLQGHDLTNVSLTWPRQFPETHAVITRMVMLWKRISKYLFIVRVKHT